LISPRTSFGDIRSALKWNYLGNGVRAFSQFVMGIVLARLLGPEPFGIVAGAWIVISLGSLISDLGFAAAVVQKAALTDDDIRHAFTLQLLVGLLLAGSVILLAPAVSAALALPKLTPVLRVLSALFVLQSFGLTGSALLRRRLDYKSLQKAQATSYIMAFAFVGLPMAWFGGGVWSLVTAQLLQALLLSAGLYHLTRHSIRPLFAARDLAIRNFGVRVLSTNMVNWSLENLDNVAVGRFQGAISLGLYNRAFSLMMMPVGNVVAVIQSVLFSSVARLQDVPGRLRQLYLGSLSAVSLLLLPIFIGVAAVPDTVIIGLYGPRWSAAASVLRPLAIALGFHSVMALAGPVLQGSGRVTRELWRQLISATIMLLALMIAGRVSLVVLAWTVCGVYVIRCLLMTSGVMALLELRWADVLKAVSGGAILACIVGVTLLAANPLLQPIPPSVRIGLVVLLAGLETCFLIALRPRYFLDMDILHHFSRAGGRTQPVALWLIARSGTLIAPPV
jgi:lipopolysaccharide exporter